MSTKNVPEVGLEALPLPTIVLDKEQRLTAANAAFSAEFGDPSALIGEPLDAIFDPRDRRNVRRFHRAMSKHKDGVLTAELRLKIDAPAPARLHMRPGEAGWVVSVISTAHEQEATESLQQARSGLRAILSCMSDGLLVINTDGAVQDCNQAALALFRFTSSHGVLLNSEAVMGRTLAELFSEEAAADIAARVAKVSDDPDLVETMNLSMNERSLVISINPIFVPRKGYQGACITARDLTEVEQLHHQISAKNDDMRRVLDNVQQGLLTVDLDGVIAPERSAVFDAWVGACEPGTTLFEAVDRLDADTGLRLEMGWEQLSWGVLPVELCLYQLPSTFSSKDRHFSLQYEPISVDGELERVLVMMTDTTEAIRREAAERLQKESVKAFEAISRDRAGFESFYKDAERIIALVRSGPGADRALFAREVHTLKGNAGVMGLSGVLECCHDLETAMAEKGGELSDADKQPLLEWWAELSKSIQRFLQVGEEDALVISIAEYTTLEHQIASEIPHDALLRQLQSLRLESARARMQRLGRQASSLARRLGKGDISVEIDADGVRLDGEVWGAFWSALVHVIRNGVDHGLEAPDAREASGKDAPPTLWLRARQDDHHTVIEVEDNGGGISWERIAAKARAHGMPADTADDLIAALLSDGVSSRDEVTATSGRGVGTAAIAAATEALGGTISVDSTPGQGTCFRFSFPQRVAEAA